MAGLRQRGGGYGGRGVWSGPLEGRRLWDIGTWGNASEHIGRRWEHLGLTALRARLAASREFWRTDRPPVVAPLLGEDLQVKLRGLGITNADALLVEAEDTTLHVRSVDFKWSLETAAYRQISEIALAALIEHPDSPVREAVLASAGCPVPQPAIVPGDGFFFVPDSRPNRQFLESAANRRQEFPLDPRDVVFEPVDGVSFFESLPGWSMGLRLADLDQSSEGLLDLDGVERYYRLGAGVRGALGKLATSLFATTPPDVDVEAELARRLRDRQLCATRAIVEHLGRLMEQRAERLRRLREVWRCPYSFRDLLADLGQRGVVVPEDDAGRAERERWGQVHRTLVEIHRAHVSQLGQELVEAGQTEAEAITVLERRRTELLARVRAHAQWLVRRELG